MTYKFKPKMFFLFVGIYLCYLGYLSIYLLLPYGDEVCFADMTYNLGSKNLLIYAVNPLLNLDWELHKREILVYGNVYFSIISYFCAILGGFAMENYRIANFLTSILSLFIAYRCISYKNYLSSKYVYFFILLYIFDIAFIQATAQFRMEQMAVCFGLSAIYCCLVTASSNQNYGKLYAFMAGFFVTCCLLTTPRSAILLLPIGLFYLMRSIKDNKKLIEFLYFCTIIVLLYGIWIGFKFGNIENFINYYTATKIQTVSLQANNNILEAFSPFSTPFSLHVFQYPTLFMSLILIGIQVKNFKKVFINDYFMFSSLLILIGYYLFIHAELYMFYVLPFTFVIILKSLQNIESNSNKNYILSGISLYILFSFLSVFFYRAIKLQTFSASKNHYDLYRQISQAIPQNSNVVGNEIYYYSLIENKINFQTINIMLPPLKDKTVIDLPKTIERIITVHKTRFKPNYFIFANNNQGRNKMLQDAYFKQFSLVPYKEIVISKNENIIEKSLKSLYKKLGLATPTNYNGMIYKVIEPQ